MHRRGLLTAAALATLSLAGCRPRAQAVAGPSAAAIGGPFQLIDQDGRPASDRDLQGKPTVVFFGFTFCPEICPTTLGRIAEWTKALGPDAGGISVVFITVDPDRDTPARLKTYLASFDPRFRGFTGSEQAIAQAAHGYNVFFQKVLLAGGGYTMDHSTGVYLMDRRGRFTEMLSTDQTTSEAVEALRRVLHG